MKFSHENLLCINILSVCECITLIIKYSCVGMLTAMLKIQIFMTFFGRKNDVETMSKFRCLFNVEMMSAFDVEMMLKRCLIVI